MTVQNIHSNFKEQISSQTINNYLTTSTSPNPYITRRLNNMDKVQAMKTEQDDWTKLYHKMLKGLEVMVDIQEQVWNMMKIVGETNITIMEMEEIILKASVNNWIINVTNISGVLEDLQYSIQSDIENWIFQIQRMLADKLDTYRGRENSYMDNNIWEIQELYKEEELKKEEGMIEDEEVILIKLYEVSELTSLTTKSSFINDKVDNLLK